MKKLKELSAMLSNDLEINGYSEAAETRKKKFETVGKAAMKELAGLLGLVKPDISFNRAGMACCGEFSLKGFRNGKGIYIMVSKDCLDGVLYRSIKDMKDFTGGCNNYLPFSKLADEDSVMQLLSRVN